MQHWRERGRETPSPVHPPQHSPQMNLEIAKLERIHTGDLQKIAVLWNQFHLSIRCLNPSDEANFHVRWLLRRLSRFCRQIVPVVDATNLPRLDLTDYPDFRPTPGPKY